MRDDAAVFLLACRDPDSGWQLHAVPSATCSTHVTPTLDPTRDLAVVHWPLSADTLLAYGVAAEASVGLLADRGAAGSAALLNGLADRMITLAADDVKERHRSGPTDGDGGAAPGRCPGQTRIGPTSDVPCRLVSRQRPADRVP